MLAVLCGGCPCCSVLGYGMLHPESFVLCSSLSQVCAVLAKFCIRQSSAGRRIWTTGVTCFHTDTSFTLVWMCTIKLDAGCVAFKSHPCTCIIDSDPFKVLWKYIMNVPHFLTMITCNSDQLTSEILFIRHQSSTADTSTTPDTL